MSLRRPRVAVVTPFLDRRHGTERCVVEQVERLATRHGWDVWVYSTRVEDVRGPIVWRRVPRGPGPGLVRYLWWFAANHAVRWWDRRVHGVRHDVVYSPGINCLDAQVVSVHIVFAEFVRRVRDGLAFRRWPVRSWPRLLHRRLYYRFVIGLERLVYGRGASWLLPVSHKVAQDLERFYGRNGRTKVLHHGVDRTQFSPAVRAALRTPARAALGLPEDTFALLLVGNDWTKKGLECALGALARLGDERCCLLVVGRDDARRFQALVARHELATRVRFLAPRPDVEFYYAAADCYVAPSLEDAFALPVLEAMAMGLPVIVSRHAGASEIVTDGVEGLILEDPRDAEQLAALIRRVLDDGELRCRLGANAANTVRRHTWDRNAEELDQVLRGSLERPS